jgi:hypothetical protein
MMFGINYRQITTNNFASIQPGITGPRANIRGVAWNGSLFAVVGENIGGTSFPPPQIITSPDGLTWTDRVPDTSVGDLWAVVWGGGQFVAVGESGLTEPPILTSPDGITWTSRPSPAIGLILRSIAFGAGRYVACDGFNNTYIHSTDGITWTSSTIPGATNGINRIVFANGLFIAVSTSTGGIIYKSTDGLTWTQQNLGLTGSLRAITWTGSLYVIGGTGGVVVRSSDGSSWTSASIAGASTAIVTSMSWTGAIIVAGGSQANTVYVSENAVTWTTVNATTVNNFINQFIGGTSAYSATRGVVGFSSSASINVSPRPPTMIW